VIRLYSDDEERRLRLRDLIGEWSAAGLLNDEQAIALDARVGTDLKRTNDLLRAALALFTVVLVVAAIAFVLSLFGIRDHLSSAIVTGVAALACLAGADGLVRRARVYRYGVEEALATASLVLACMSTNLFTREPGPVNGYPAPFVVGAAWALYVYLRFGFAYAAVGALTFAAFTPAQFALSGHASRASAALVFASGFAASRYLRRPYGDDFPGDQYAFMQAVAAVGVYLVLNLRIGDVWPAAVGAPVGPDWFYWTTFAATWIVPAVVLTLAVRDGDRPLLDAGLLLALITLVTNKPYLGIARQTWDPILLGVLLVGGAVAIKRWLASGEAGARHGYTADRLSARDRELLTLLGNLSVVAPMPRPPAQPETVSSFAGGRSGGGGGGASF
jgi:hypothetical protein